MEPLTVALPPLPLNGARDDALKELRGLIGSATGEIASTNGDLNAATLSIRDSLNHLAPHTAVEESGADGDEELAVGEVEARGLKTTNGAA